jgi:hypothetical protein
MYQLGSELIVAAISFAEEGSADVNIGDMLTTADDILTSIDSLGRTFCTTSRKN